MGQSTSPGRRAPAKELLEANHSFPGSYLIKAFGPATDAFRSGIDGAARRAVGARFEASERLGSKGKSICITLTLAAEHVDEVVSAYERLHEVPGLKMIL
jgi:putative lipoic acid-binding regulatory protein